MFIFFFVILPTDLKLDCDIKKVSVYEFGTINNNEGMELTGTKGSGKSAAARCESAGLIMQFLVLFQRNVTASLRNSVSCPFMIFGAIIPISDIFLQKNEGVN